MSTIEKAAKRLEELRQAGIDVPWLRSSEQAVGVQVSPAMPRLSPVASPAPAARVPLPPVENGQSLPRFDRPTGQESKRVEIDLNRLLSMGYLAPGAKNETLAAELRVIKRPILGNITSPEGVLQPNRNLVMMTSALPGEGKTFASINLALSMATELDRTVLLVEADSARPAVLSRLGVAPSKGLLDLLSDPSLALSDVILRTNIEKLWVLPVGSHRPTATELLASTSMRDLMFELSRRYSDRVLLFDAPPLLPSTESRVLAEHMGQIVMLIEASRTTQAAVTQALATLEACPIVMLMLNKARMSMGASYGNYGY